MTKGIDVSSYQGFIDWAAVSSSGEVAFAYTKATEGVSVSDSQFARNWQVLSQRREIKRGAYHFFHFTSDPVAQANFFLAAANFQAGDLLPMVDVEVNDGVTDITQCVNILSQFLDCVERALGGKKVIVYTSYGFWNGSMNGSDAFSGHPLWIAEYNSDNAPTLPNGWNDWVIWQYESNGQINGITGDVDMDRLNGDAAALAKLII